MADGTQAGPVRRIGVIGLGTMGSPMAVNLVRAGFEVVGHTRTASTAAALLDAGGTYADTVAEAVTGADVVVTMLPDAPDVALVVAGPDGVLDHLGAGAVVADCSTIRPDVARELAAAGAERGIAVLDAPVSGGLVGAEQGTLSIMAGGEPAAVERARPALQAMGTVVHVGPSGSGQLVKAANQLIIGATIQAVAEALVMLERSGIERGPAVEALSGGMASSRVLERKAPMMLAREYPPTFRGDLHAKDLGIVEQVVAAVGVDAPVAAVVADRLRELVAAGYGGLDHAALHLLVERSSDAAY